MLVRGSMPVNQTWRQKTKHIVCKRRRQSWPWGRETWKFRDYLRYPWKFMWRISRTKLRSCTLISSNIASFWASTFIFVFIILWLVIEPSRKKENKGQNGTSHGHPGSFVNNVHNVYNFKYVHNVHKVYNECFVHNLHEVNNVNNVNFYHCFLIINLNIILIIFLITILIIFLIIILIIILL